MAGPTCTALRVAARREGALRALRLLGEDELLNERLNSGFLDTDEYLWNAWRLSEAGPHR